MFKNAIVRQPGRSLINGLTKTPEYGVPDYDLALVQHQGYVQILKQLGLAVTELAPNEAFPDSCFIEDNALCTAECVIICRPGAETRRAEADLPDLHAALEHFYGSKIERIVAPGTVEPGDIQMIGDHFMVGLSDRTNRQGAEQIITLLKKYGYTGEIIEVKNFLHLKDDISYLDNNNMVVAEHFKDDPAIAKFNRLVVPTEEYYAANVLLINDQVIVPAGYPVIENLIKQAGYSVITCNMSEFRKINGSLTCLSLRF